MHVARENEGCRAPRRYSGLALFCGCAVVLFAYGAGAQSLSIDGMSSTDASALRKALDAYDQGRVEDAEPVLLDLTARYPTSYVASEALGGLFAESGKMDRALPLLKRAASLAPRQAVSHANLGAAYLKLGKNSDAVKELQLAAKLEAKNAATQSNLGQALMVTGQPGAAARCFALAAELEPAHWDVVYNWALALAESNAPREAYSTLAKIPNEAMTAQAQSLAGDVDEKLGKYKEAIGRYQAAAQADPSDGNLYTLTAELLRHWTWEEAIQIASYGASKYPEAVHFKVAIGIAQYGSSKYPAAAATFAELLAKEPESGFYADLLGRSCGSIADEVNTDCNGLEAFARRHPENARASTYAAASILKRPAAEQDTGKAEDLLQQAIRSDPKLTEAYYQLGVLAQQRSQWKESAAVLEKAVALRPAYPEAHYRLARAYAHMGLREEAQKQTALQQQYSLKEKDNLDARMQEVVTFLLKPS